MIMILCHLSDFLEFIRNRLNHCTGSVSAQKLIEGAAQNYYDQTISKLIELKKFQYSHQYSRRLTILSKSRTDVRDQLTAYRSRKAR